MIYFRTSKTSYMPSTRNYTASKEYNHTSGVRKTEPKLDSDGTIYLGSSNSSEIMAVYPTGQEKWRISLKEHA
ncbi:hypothetical protein O0550_05135 [Brevibacillus halotolerans]|uniref:hypothetical protein n=1 Tax=Brevibacillus TaxID=55080 RepID=UPI00215CB4F8|nr:MULTISPECIES: hypothetical protein [Brevibacillus]MCR8962602.1 hypothetical protein [Brevibacillus laterosporus]MCZ0834757.1 hypothetical protein [Brevibacillus halotolerans]